MAHSLTPLVWMLDLLQRKWRRNSALLQWFDIVNAMTFLWKIANNYHLSPLDSCTPHTLSGLKFTGDYSQAENGSI